ncbi:hypothetical protein SO802_014021 [Lithocarpus litseifolius]|uniref:Disease resistance N-terminal domain-containing protein n=1 Tax=Lithocarpus litseifolius TaxID=425828 RepID=A0AAW2DB61_9ROSI
MDRADWDQQVSEIKSQLFSEFTSESKLIANVKEEVPKLESKFRSIQAVLNDAEKRRVKEEAVKLWLDKLKDVSNQMKSVLDKWNTATKIVEDNEKKDEEEEAATSTAKRRKNNLGNPFEPGAFSGFMLHFTFLISSPVAEEWMMTSALGDITDDVSKNRWRCVTEVLLLLAAREGSCGLQ